MIKLAIEASLNNHDDGYGTSQSGTAGLSHQSVFYRPCHILLLLLQVDNYHAPAGDAQMAHMKWKNFTNGCSGKVLNLLRESTN